MNNLTKAFKELRKAGYFARQNFSCCQSCGWSEVPENTNKAVFYHAQDNYDKNNGRPFYLSWSGNGYEICNILEKNGVTTDWNEKDSTRIKITKW